MELIDEIEVRKRAGLGDHAAILLRVTEPDGA
jgi:hypothetical protein